MDAAEAARLLVEQRRMRERFQAEQSAEAGRQSAAELRASGGRLEARAAHVAPKKTGTACNASPVFEKAK